MRVADKLRHQGSMDSRRVSTGTRCKIVHGPRLISFIQKALLVRSEIMSMIHPDTGHDDTTGATLVMPLHKLEELNLLWEEYVSSDSETEDAEKISRELGPEAAMSKDSAGRRLKEFLKVSLLIVYLSRNDPVLAGTPLKKSFLPDVFIDTTEVSQGIARLIPMSENISGRTRNG